MENNGSVQKYPCTCHNSGICWIVRHPDLSPPVSYDTEEEAKKVLEGLRNGIQPKFEEDEP